MKKNLSRRIFALAANLLYWVLTVQFELINTNAIAQASGVFVVKGKTISISKFNAEVEAMMQRVGVPGLSLAVINNNKVVFYNTYGSKSSKVSSPVDRNTIFEACSLSKTFLVFLVHQLADAKMIDLDKPLYQYLAYEPLAHDDRYKLITARMVLSHSSGIENSRNESKHQQLEIISDPGGKFNYSSEGYIYLGKVVKTILKKDEFQYLNELVFDPLGLKRTFSRYSSDGTQPVNYAIGHNKFGIEVEKWKNKDVIVSGGVHTTANDYAKLIVAIFNEKKLSHLRIRDITSPTINIDDGASRLYWGAGLGVEYFKGDTIVFQNGVHDAFRGWMHYSIVNKCGIAFFANDAWGLSLVKELNKISVALEIQPLLDGMNEPQYPSQFLTLLDVYRRGTVNKLLLKIDEINRTRQPNSFQTVNDLAWIIFENNTTVAKQVMEKNLVLHSDDPLAYYNCGLLNYKLREYDLALVRFQKCQALNLSDANIVGKIKECELALAKK